MTEERILLVDDDPHLLSALRRQLGDEFALTTASTGKDAVEAVRSAAKERAPFAVALCDMRMPGMNGVETLAAIREAAPDTVRMMLTGHADQETSIQAINRGNILRFYLKPCPAEQLREGLRAGVHQYHLVTAERDLLERTLTGSLRVLIDALSMNDPVAFAHTARMREWVRALGPALSLPKPWQIEIAATLHEIGRLAIPAEIIAKKASGEALSDLEQALIDRTPEFGRNLLVNVPRLEKVAEIVLLQDRGFDGSGFPADGPTGEAIPAGARLLRILKDLSAACGNGPLTEAAFAMLERRRVQYDPRLLATVHVTLDAAFAALPQSEIEIPLAVLSVGQTLVNDLRLVNGHLILTADTCISEILLERLHALRRIYAFVEPIRVRT
ncbi:MAG: response regulator [Alphaproteobacteria bacterium]|nr:response regulator [Alphaproteobacteria bacterium]